MTALPLTFSLEPRYKEQFASFLIAGFSPFIAGMKLWPTNAGLASQVANDWPHDPYVLACIEVSKEKQETDNKPKTKVSQIKRIEERLARMDDDDYIKAERLIAEMSGNIERAAPPSVTVNNQNNSIERVLVVRDHGSDDEWEKRTAAQQSKLIENNV